MDPNQTLADLIDAATDGDTETFFHCANDLHEWMYRGGFSPRLEDVLAILTVKE